MLTDEEWLKLYSLTNNKKPCDYAVMAHRLGIVCDMICPVRKMISAEFQKIQADIENDKFEREFPNG